MGSPSLKSRNWRRSGRNCDLGLGMRNQKSSGRLRFQRMTNPSQWLVPAKDPAMIASTTTESTSPTANSGMRRAIASPRLQAERQRRVVNAAIKELIRQYKQSHASDERRRQGASIFCKRSKCGWKTIVN